MLSLASYVEMYFQLMSGIVQAQKSIYSVNNVFQ